MGYDVFMSFRGEDTRMTFTSHLYDALTRNDIITYKDDKTLEIGSPIAAELLEAIETSRFAVVVLSRSFATSKWCLEEIAKIVDRMKQGKLIVIPVFYHVSPSDVRHQSNCFEQGFATHEVDPEIAPQKVEIWRAAFIEVGALAGLHVTENRNESEVISEIVSRILKDTPDTLPNDLSNGLVGIKSRVDEVTRILRMDSSEVLFIGICGMSGIGKTTLAEVVYKDIQNKFVKSSFIENIKDISKQDDSTDLCKLQQKLLDDILKEKSIHVQHVKHGQTLLGTKLRGFKVIIVLDDLNHVDQLTYLAGELEWFGPGSRIIVTTTNVDMLKCHKIREIYACEEMKGDEALRLFCQSAFDQGHPTLGYEKLSDDMVKIAGGLPLALNVYGSILCGKEEDYWEVMLKKLQEYPPKEVLGRLGVVYARLDRYQQRALIYIACFLKGRHIDLVKDILMNIGLFPGCEITDLMNKFLISINHEDSVWMHDLVQQMCWEFLRKELHSDDGKYMAIKYRQDIVDILSSKPKGIQTIEIVNQEPYKVEVDDCFIDPACFEEMKKLKFLKISNVHFHQGFTYLSNDLRILEWYGCSLKSFPSTFEPKHMYELEMCCSQLKTLWKKDLDLPNLRSINLSFSKNLTKIPGLTSTVNLVKLNLEGCTKLAELHKSVLLHKRLRYMNLKGCTSLRSLGRSTMEMEALEALLLSGCSNLESIPEFGHNMKRLEHLQVDGTKIKKLPDNLGQMCDLRKLDAGGTSVEELPSSINRLRKLRLLRVNRCLLSFKMGDFLYTSLNTSSPCLREVDLSNCNLSMVPDAIGLLWCLITLDLSGNEFVSLPVSIGLLSKLRVLCLNNCKRLLSLPKLSLVDDDSDYGPRSRFSYYVSAEEIDVSKFHATSNYASPTVSCLNCPKLAENEQGEFLAEKILNNYLQLRTKYWMTPEAVFQSVGGRSKTSYGSFRFGCEHYYIVGPWIGVAICAVIAVQHVDDYMEAKYVVTAHIYLEDEHWKIPVPINFLVAELENHLVFYWTVADDLQRIIGSSQGKNLSVSFDVDPGDGNLQVTNFGARIIYKEDILRLKLSGEYMTSVVSDVCGRFDLPPVWYIAACEADTNLPSSYQIINDHFRRVMDSVFNQGELLSLDGIHQIIKGLHGISKEFFGVLSVCKNKWKKKIWVYHYYRMSLEISKLCNEFVRLLKTINDGWLSVKLGLEQIGLKRRADNYSYKEILQHLNDHEAAQSVGLHNNFMTMFVSTFKRAICTIKKFNIDIRGQNTSKPEEILAKKKFKHVRVLAKLSSFTIAGVFCVMATFIGNFKLLNEMKHMDLYSISLHLIGAFTDKIIEMLKELERSMAGHDWELKISDFIDNGILLQDLTIKMVSSSCFTKENEEEMMIVIDKLQKKYDRLSYTLQHMSNDADKYTQDIWKARKHVKSFSRLKRGDRRGCGCGW